MLTQKNALLLVGSPKKTGSSSDSLGSYLMDKLSEKGHSTNKLHILSSLGNNASIENLLDAVDSSDIIVLSFPVYVDSLPASVIKTFELIASHREKNISNKKHKMIAISNCGFPEALHNSTALDICKCFANKVGFEWLGALALGSGGAIAGRPLEELGGMVRNVVKSLDITAEALVNENSVPQKAIELMEKQLVPSWLYTFMGSIGWKKEAKRFGCSKELYAKPYENH